MADPSQWVMWGGLWTDLVAKLYFIFRTFTVVLHLLVTSSSSNTYVKSFSRTFTHKKVLFLR